VLPPIVASAVAVLWILLPAYLASAFATLPRGRGPAMDFGRTVAHDGRRILGASKTWSGFVVGSLLAVPFGLLEAWLILIAPPNLQLVPRFAGSVVAAVPVVALVSFGAMTGDALGSFVKRRVGFDSGARALFVDQLPFVVVPILLGIGLYPAVFVPVFVSWMGVVWLLIFTLGLHVAFNWVGFQVGLKKVPW
jgi:CDP-2,3-bis-(O-geranylgeranyl)-sn-glycerol synthase